MTHTHEREDREEGVQETGKTGAWIRGRFLPLMCGVKLCLHERLLAYLSPDTVTGDDGRHQNRCRGGCRLKWNMSQCLVRSDTVIYEAANQRPVDELLLTFSPAGAIFDAV